MRSLALLLLCSLFPTPVSRSADAPGVSPFEHSFHPLFTIERSLNSNRLTYEVKLTPEGFPSNPIRVYWTMRTKGDAIENLTPLEEQSAYGVSLHEVDANRVVFSMRSLPDRPITVKREVDDHGRIRIRAFTKIGEEPQILESIFIHLGRGLLIPKIQKIRLNGRSVLTNEPIEETLEP